MMHCCTSYLKRHYLTLSVTADAACRRTPRQSYVFTEVCTDLTSEVLPEIWQRACSHVTPLSPLLLTSPPVSHVRVSEHHLHLDKARWSSVTQQVGSITITALCWTNQPPPPPPPPPPELFTEKHDIIQK